MEYWLVDPQNFGTLISVRRECRRRYSQQRYAKTAPIIPVICIVYKIYRVCERGRQGQIRPLFASSKIYSVGMKIRGCLGHCDALKRATLVAELKGTTESRYSSWSLSDLNVPSIPRKTRLLVMHVRLSLVLTTLAPRPKAVSTISRVGLRSGRAKEFQ